MSESWRRYQVAVIDAPESGVLTALAQPVGQILLAPGLKRDSVPAIGWGRAVSAVIEAGLPIIPGVVTVQATGGCSR